MTTDALSRLDDGTPLPGDAALAGVFDRHASDYWHAVNAQVDRWQADRCVVCGKAGEGPECGSCTADHDFTISRLTDI